MENNNQNNQLHDLSYLTLFSSFLGCMNYAENLKQTSNDDLMEEMKKQTKDYIEKNIEKSDIIILQNKEIILQNEKIINLLENEVSR